MTFKLRSRLMLGAALLLADATLAAPAFAGAADQGAVDAVAADVTTNAAIGEVVITARHRTEDPQKVPVAVSVLTDQFIAKTNTLDIEQIAQLEPSVQFSFFNARNANINIRGLGNNVGLANDGLEPGVGFYVDGVYYARPAGATFDLVDLDQVEVLRGPQGTLFGKNTTAGAIDITTKAPTFTPEAIGEITGGNYGTFQAKADLSGPLVADKLAARLSFATNEHNGYLTNIYDGKGSDAERDLNLRAQVLYTPNSDIKVRIIGDYNRQISNCCDEVLAGIVRPPNGKNFTTLAESFGYTPVVDPFNREADTNSQIQARQEQGGVSAQVDWALPGATLTSISAWRFWNWWPANDSDYTPLSVLTEAQNGDKEDQYSQELRIASTGVHKLDYVGGLYFFDEQIHALGGSHYGNAASAFLLGAAVPSVVANGYDLDFNSYYFTKSYAAYGQATWHVIPRLNITGGLRYTYDQKNGSFDQVASGGATLPGSLQPLRNALGTSDVFTVNYSQGNLSGLATVSYQLTPDILTYVTYARGNKSGGLNLTQLPPGASSVIAPETIDSVEGGAKTAFFDHRLILNADLFWENDTNYQANLYNSALGKQYLSNVPKVRSQGVEIDAQAQPINHVSLYGSLTYDDAVYASYANGVCGLENITLSHCNLSGAPLAGVPRWAASAGGEVSQPLKLGSHEAETYLGVDYSFRSSLYSASTDSIYSRLPSLNLVNARLGLRSANGRWDAYVFARNLLNKSYFLFIAPGVGNTGALDGELGDPRTFGVTLRAHI
jgi:iron complex outermembrane receptor protein